MKIRHKLLLIGILPASLLVLLTAVFLWATSQVNRANQKALLAEATVTTLNQLSILTYEHYVYFEERAHVQWEEKYALFRRQLLEQADEYDTEKEKELMSRLLRTSRNLGFLFAQHGPHPANSQRTHYSEEEKSFVERITARILQELAVAAPAAGALRDLNHARAIQLSRQISLISMLVVGVLTGVLLLLAFQVIRAFSVPMGILEKAFAAISSGDYTCRINSRVGDELGALSRDFDAMAGRLEESHNSLHLLNLELEQRVAERTDELVRANAELSLAEKRYRTIFNESPDGVVLFDPQTSEVVEFNDVAPRQLGYGRDEFAHLSISDYEVWDSPEEIQQRMRAVFLQERLTFETEHRTKTGEIRNVAILAQVLVLGSRRYVYVIYRDITELRQAQEELKKYAASLERSNRELEHFAYVASHDLQEPLRKIGSFTELLSRKYQGRLDEKADSYIGFIVDGARRMQVLINDLLAFSRVTTKGQDFEVVDCNRLLARVRYDCELALRESGARLEVRELPTINGDDVQLGQLFQNLLGNAIKYRIPDQAPEIVVSAVQRGGMWVFSVRDNGIGIESQHFERIFQLFQRLHTREEYPGTGIGLALCQRIVQRHGGRIWVESSPGQGSTFFFSVPCVLPESVDSGDAGSVSG